MKVGSRFETAGQLAAAFLCGHVPIVSVFFLPLFKDMLPVYVVECVCLILLVKSKACILMHQYQESNDVTYDNIAVKGGIFFVEQLLLLLIL